MRIKLKGNNKIALDNGHVYELNQYDYEHLMQVFVYSPEDLYRTWSYGINRRAVLIK